MDLATLLPTVQAYLQAGAPPDVLVWNPAQPFAVLPLGQLGDPAAIPVLWALMQDSNAMIPGRLAALRALTHFDVDTARAALAWAAACERPALRDEAEDLEAITLAKVSEPSQG